MVSKYFYDKQLRRYLLQIARIFSGYQVRDGFETINGERVPRYKQVPVAHANISRVGATFLQSNSENMMLNAPAMAFYISDLQPATDYRQYQHHMQHSRFTEKQKDTEGNYINKAGKKYEVVQNMPVPFEMKINLDIWTSSMEQKMEIFEQISVYFNPGFEFRVTSSRFDMGQKANIELESVQWTSKSVPIGTSTDIDFMTLTFKILPVRISAPAKITRQNIIKTVSIGGSLNSELNGLDSIFEGTPLHNIYVSPTDHELEVKKEMVGSVKRHIARIINTGAEEYTRWEDIFKLYGVDLESSTLIRMRQNSDLDNDSNDVYATLKISEDDPFVAFIEYDVDTFKPNSIEPINGIISGTNTNESMFNSDNGTRFIVATVMTENPIWNLEVTPHSIIEKIDGVWTIVLDGSIHNTVEYVLNTTSNEQYKFIPEINAWQPTNIGTYAEGFWSFDIQKVIDVSKK